MAVSISGITAVKGVPPVVVPPPSNGVIPTVDQVGVPAGTTLTSWSTSRTFTANDITYNNIDFGGGVTLTGSNITLNNCRFSSMVYFGPGPLTLDHCETTGGNINVDGSKGNVTGVTFQWCHIVCGQHDGIDLFSQSVGKLSNVTITDTWVDGMDFPSTSTAHGDGLQVRGINGLIVQRCMFDMYHIGGVESQKNAAIYFEDVNGGDIDMHFTDIEIWGGDPFNHTFYTNEVTSSTATNVAIKRGGFVTRVHPSGWTFNNVTGPSGTQLSPN